MEKQKNYGFLSNYLYAIKMAAKSSRFMLWTILSLAIIEILRELLIIYAPKIILNLVENDSQIKNFVISIVLIGIGIILFDIFMDIIWQIFDILYVKTDSFLEKLRMEKVYKTDYKNMESPEFLDYIQRAKTSLYHGNGFHGMLFQSRNFLSQGGFVIISAFLIGTKNVIVVILLCVMSVIGGRILAYVSKLDKIKYMDVLAPTFRKINYLDRTTKNFDFAKDIRLFRMSGIFRNEFKKVNDVYRKKMRERHTLWIHCNLGTESVIMIQKGLMYGWLAYLVIAKGLSISDFVLYIGLVTGLMDSIGNFMWVYYSLKGNNYMVNDYRNFIEWQEMNDMLQEKPGITDLEFDQYEFKFENVSFKYPGHDNYVLKNINLTIQSGSKLAVVGVNGAGKTTFIKLIMKLYEPTEGRILLNGVDIKEYDREAYFKQFSPVFQNVECFALPIYQNISFADEEHTDMEKVEEALKKSGLDQKISLYEKGVHTNLLKIFDENGIDLSGGEKQRLAMARALYKGGNVVILDEPTAALDALAEDRMYREFENMVGQKTSIFISHRLGSTRFCNKIAMFEDGKIVEEGTHQELMKLNGKYAYMFNIQSQYYKGGQEDESI